MSTSTSLTEVVRREMAPYLALSDEQLASLEMHYQLLLTWNKRMNLTTVTALPEAAIRHYCESLFLASHLTPGRVADVGSGAGFPGFPVAVARPDCEVTLVESNSRKCVFLKESSRGVTNVKVRAERGQSLSKDYDWVISRAVDPAEVVSLGAGARCALLVGEDEKSRFPGAQAVNLPWGDRRTLLIVSRGTAT